MGCFGGICERIRSWINQPALPTRSFASWTIVLANLPDDLTLETAKHLACLDAAYIVIASDDRSIGLGIAKETKRKMREYNIWLSSQLLETRGVYEDERGKWRLKSAIEAIEWKRNEKKFDGAELLQCLRSICPAACKGTGCVVVGVEETCLVADINCMNPTRPVGDGAAADALRYGTVTDDPPAYEESNRGRSDSVAQAGLADELTASSGKVPPPCIDSSNTASSDLDIERADPKTSASGVQATVAGSGPQNWSRFRLNDPGSKKNICVNVSASAKDAEKTSRKVLNSLAKRLPS